MSRPDRTLNLSSDNNLGNEMSVNVDLTGPAPLP
jgi:hypothetical protein